MGLRRVYALWAALLAALAGLGSCSGRETYIPAGVAPVEIPHPTAKLEQATVTPAEQVQADQPILFTAVTNGPVADATISAYLYSNVDWTRNTAISLHDDGLGSDATALDGNWSGLGAWPYDVAEQLRLWVTLDFSGGESGETYESQSLDLPDLAVVVPAADKES